MEQNISAPIFNRFFAFLIDSFLIYLIRFFYVNLSLMYWLKEPIMNFMEKYKLLYGKINFANITRIEITYFLKSNLFTQLIIFLIGIFLISIIYNIILLSTKWSATIGQKIFGIYVIGKNGNKMRIYQVIARSILIVLPWFFLFIIIFYKALSGLGKVEILDQTSFVISLIIFLSWYDMIFLTKNKLVFHDYITCTQVIVKDSAKYSNKSTKSISDILFPNFKDVYNNIKIFAKDQIKKAKETKEKYKKEKELNKKNKK